MTSRAASLACLGWILACAAPPPPAAPKVRIRVAPDPPSAPAAASAWAPYATPTAGWAPADLVDGRRVWLDRCAPHRSCCWLDGDTITEETGSGEGHDYTVVGGHPSGDGLALDVRDGAILRSWRVRWDGEAVVFAVGDGSEVHMYRRDAPLPRFEECCTSSEDDPIGAPTGEIVPAGQPCKE